MYEGDANCCCGCTAGWNQGGCQWKHRPIFTPRTMAPKRVRFAVEEEGGCEHCSDTGRELTRPACSPACHPALLPMMLSLGSGTLVHKLWSSHQPRRPLATRQSEEVPGSHAWVVGGRRHAGGETLRAIQAGAPLPGAESPHYNPIARPYSRQRRSRGEQAAWSHCRPHGALGSVAPAFGDAQ